MRDALTDAYRATTYAARTPLGEVRLRIGEADATLDRLLDAAGVEAWAHVTACNPGSRRLSDADNARRSAALRRVVGRRGWRFFEGEGVGDDGRWPAEAAVLVLGIAERRARALGRLFGQNAVVVGRRSAAARLADCRRKFPVGGRRDAP